LIIPVSLDEIEAFVRSNANAEIRFRKVAEAREYRETVTMLEQVEHAEHIVVVSPFPDSII
jgi:hypothetical protein